MSEEEEEEEEWYGVQCAWSSKCGGYLIFIGIKMSLHMDII